MPTEKMPTNKVPTDKMPNDLLAFCPNKIPIEIETDKCQITKKSLDKMLTNHLAFSGKS